MSQENCLILLPLVPHLIRILVITTSYFAWNKIVDVTIEMLRKENFKSSKLLSYLLKKKWNRFINQKHLIKNTEE